MSVLHPSTSCNCSVVSMMFSKVYPKSRNMKAYFWKASLLFRVRLGFSLFSWWSDVLLLHENRGDTKGESEPEERTQGWDRDKANADCRATWDLILRSVPIAHSYVFFYLHSMDKIKRQANFAILCFFANSLPLNLAPLDNLHFIFISPCGGVGIWAIPLQLVT